MANRVNICWGLKEGNSGVTDGPRDVAQADAGDVRNPSDPQGWHALPESDGPGFRRAQLPPVTPALALILLGGLRELTALTVEDGADLRGILEPAVVAATAILGPRVSPA